MPLQLHSQSYRAQMGDLPWLYELGIVDEVELGLLDRSAAGVFRSAVRASAYRSRKRSCSHDNDGAFAPVHRRAATHLRACA